RANRSPAAPAAPRGARLHPGIVAQSYRRPAALARGPGPAHRNPEPSRRRPAHRVRVRCRRRRGAPGHPAGRLPHSGRAAAQCLAPRPGPAGARGGARPGSSGPVRQRPRAAAAARNDS
nr:hypothetical protein [Tanacetum cinerariifolium]